MTTRKMSRAQKKNGININLTDLKHDSTCIILSLPLQLCYDICMPIKMASVHMEKKSSHGKKRHCDGNKKYSCAQLWLSEWAEEGITLGLQRKHCLTRR